MTNDERIAGFATEFNALQQKYGVGLIAKIVATSDTWPPPPDAKLKTTIEMAFIDSWIEPVKSDTIETELTKDQDQ